MLESFLYSRQPPPPPSPSTTTHIVTTPTQQQLNSTLTLQNLSWVWVTPCDTKTRYQQYLSCYWTDLDHTSKVGFLDHRQPKQWQQQEQYPHHQQQHFIYYWDNFDKTLKDFLGSTTITASSATTTTITKFLRCQKFMAFKTIVGSKH